MDKHMQELRRNDQITKAKLDQLYAFCSEMYDELRKVKAFVKYVPPENPPVQKSANKSQLDEALRNVDTIQTSTGRKKIINN